jgi:hypothetical protein
MNKTIEDFQKDASIPNKERNTAKKTVTIEIEHNGQIYKSVMDATLGLQVSVQKKGMVTGFVCCSPAALINFAGSLLDSLPVKLQLLLLLKMGIGKDEGDKDHDE